MKLLADSSDMVTSYSPTTGCDMADIVNVRGDITWNCVTLKKKIDTQMSCK